MLLSRNGGRTHATAAIMPMITMMNPGNSWGLVVMKGNAVAPFIFLGSDNIEFSCQHDLDDVDRKSLNIKRVVFL